MQLIILVSRNWFLFHDFLVVDVVRINFDQNENNLKNYFFGVIYKNICYFEPFKTRMWFRFKCINFAKIVMWVTSITSVVTQEHNQCNTESLPISLLLLSLSASTTHLVLPNFHCFKTLLLLSFEFFSTSNFSPSLLVPFVGHATVLLHCLRIQ